MNTYTITLGQVTNAGEVCSNPIITLAGHTDNTTVNCIDESKGIYQIQTTQNLADSSLEFVVQCSECDDCPPQVIIVNLCDSDIDCGACQTCGPNGYCQSLCATGQSCVNDQCVDCTSSEGCPHNQVCQNGGCGCPEGATLGPDGRCLDCSSNSDCGTCEVCQGGICAPKECVDGVCDPESGSCIDCINSGDCDVNETCNNGTCACAEGFTRIDGVCVSVECELDGDCPACYQCSNNSCVPVSCPSGKVPAQIDGQCQCVGQCDPNNPDCPDGSYCAPSEIDGLYACVPCEGDCESGCGFPCVCDKANDQCVANPCTNTTCTDGSECGPGCGCYRGSCSPCSTLGCPGVECDQVSGCGCQGGVCKDADVISNCSEADCEISSDCGLGCTCQGGKCTSCDNFSCLQGTCAEKDGCQCLSGNCVGEDISSSCTDTLEIAKDDASCTLTGTLTKDQCCSCDEISVSVTSKSDTKVVGDDILLSFRTEIRKGAFDSNDPTANPRVDDTASPDIADNDLPSSGAVQMTFRNRFVVYTLTYDSQGNEIRNFQGSTLGARTTKTATLAGTAFVDLSGTISKIGTEVRESGTLKVVTEVIVDFELSSSLDFPNDCSYDAGTPIGSITITDNSTLGALPKIGKGVRSDDCRLPLFKWYKSDTNSFEATPFRKLYISGSGTYTDELTSVADDGLEPCKTYLLETDCTCEDAKSKKIVFCNPTDINYTLQGCNTKITFADAFIPCEVNTAAAVEYYVKAGSLDLTFTANSYPAGRTFMSMDPITEVEFGQVCDTEGECTKVYTETTPEANIPVFTTCNGDGTFTAQFAQIPKCTLTKVVLDNGTQVVGSDRIELPVGTYQAEIYTDCNCPPQTVTITQQCCTEISTPDCYRECDGTVVGCVEDTSITYTDEAGNEIPSLRDYVENAPTTTGLIINATRGACPLEQFTIPAQSQSCCDGFRYEFIQNDTGTGGTINVYGGNSVTVTLTAQSAAGGSPTVTKTSNSLFTVSNLQDGASYNIEVTDSVCGVVVDNFLTSACSLSLSATTTCELYTELPAVACSCGSIGYEAEVTNVQVLEESFVVDWRAKVLSPNVDIDLLEFQDNYGTSKKFKPESTAQVTISRLDSLGNIKNSTSLNIKLVSASLVDNCTYSNATRSFTIYANGSSLPSNTSSMSVSADDAEAKWPKFTWVTGTQTFSEYAATRSEITDDTVVFSKPMLQQGRSYEVTAVCDECEDANTVVYCCTPTITVTVANCNKEVTVSLTGAPGVYLIRYENSGAEVTITDRNTAVLRTFTASEAFTDASVEVEALNNASCTFTQAVPLITPCDPTITTSSCVADKYDVTLSGCNGAAYTITEVSGVSPDSISGNVITGVAKNSALVVNALNPATGCDYELAAGVDWSDPCTVACDPPAWTSSPLTYVEGTCNVSDVYQDDGAITLDSNDTSATVDKYGVSTLLATGASVADYDGPNYAGATAYALTAGDNVTTGLGNGPGTIVVRFYQGSDDCFTAFAVDILETDCACQLDYTVTPTSATCTSLTENNDGKVTISGYTDVTHYGVSTEDAASYDGPTTVAAATALSTDPEDIVTGISNVNPNGSGNHNYIIRLFGTTDVCFEDVAVTVTDNECTCTGPNSNSTGTYEVGTCSGSTPQDDAKVVWKLTGGEVSPSADRYHIVVGTTFDTNLTYATATALPVAQGTQGDGFEYVLKSDAPTSGETYTFRIYDGDNSCNQDFTVTIPGTVCTSSCDSVCDGKADGYVCNGAGTECQAGQCVVTQSCVDDPCTYYGFDSSGCPICKFEPTGRICGTNSECDGAGNCIAATGACCGFGASGLGCEENVTEADCASNGGTFQGDGSDCSSTYQEFLGGQASITGSTEICNNGEFVLAAYNLSGALDCFGCECAGPSISVFLYINDVQISSGSVFPSNNECNIGQTQFSNGILKVDDTDNIQAGDVVKVEYRVRNNPNEGCLTSGVADYSDTYVVSQATADAYNACFTPTATGACCEYTGNCTTKTETDCTSGDGRYKGDGTTCSSVTCTGSCCGDGYCISSTTPQQCDTDYSGVYIDYQGTCGDVCLGACCTDGTCQDGGSDATINRDTCEGGGGTWFGGNGTFCIDVDCTDV